MAKAKAKGGRGKSVLKVKAAAQGEANVYIYDEIGFYGLTAKNIQQQLAFLGDVNRINLHLNTPGGSVADGLAIFNLFRSHPAHVAVYIDGVVASMGTVIAMAGDEIIMPENTLMMIHAPWVWAEGNAEELRSTADDLDKMADAMMATYTTRTGLSEDEVRQMMSRDTWLTAAEAVELGLADRMDGAIEAAASRFRNFDTSSFKDAPAAVAALFSHGEPVQSQEEEDEMAVAKTKTKSTGGKEADAAQPVADNPAADPVADAQGGADAAASAAAAARAEERARIQHIHAAVGRAGLDPSKATEMIEANLSIDQVNAQIVEGLVQGQEPIKGQHRVTAGQDQREKFIEGAEKALMMKAGMDGGERNEFTSPDAVRNGAPVPAAPEFQYAGYGPHHNGGPVFQSCRSGRHAFHQ